MGTEGIEPPSPGLEPGSLPLAYAPRSIKLLTEILFLMFSYYSTFKTFILKIKVFPARG